MRQKYRYSASGLLPGSGGSANFDPKLTMIQRIQSLWLLLSGIGFLIHWWPGIALFKTQQHGDGVFSDGMFYARESYAALIGSGVAGILCLIAIFLYRERIMQTLIVAAACLIQLVFSVGWPYYQVFLAGQSSHSVPGLGLWISVAGLLLCWLAVRAIRRDEALVRSMDRLR
jgi:hypothetical protein